jgi:anion-transporting  ArsA/GET3 family ATPase
VLLTGKVYEAVQRPRRPDRGRHSEVITYDAVVLDAPPTGRICQFLGVNSELAGLAKVGPIKAQADKVMDLLRSPRTAVHLVTILEEMPVQETSDGIRELRAAGLPVGGVVVNLVRPRALGAGALAMVREDRVDPTQITSDLTRAKVDVDAHLVASLVEEARDHAVRRRLEDEQRELVVAEDVPTYELPRLAGGIDHGALLELAQLLRGQGMA